MVLSSFYNDLYLWYDSNGRDLPWRNTQNPYHIWVSEVIMQQTQVKQGLPYYLSFLDAFPTVLDLANASEDQVLALWQGLGYYSRARNMLKAARMVRDDLDGVFPSSYSDLIQLNGVGSYTASAVASFASNQAVGVLDGNVFRFFGRLFGIDLPINSSIGGKKFAQVVDQMLDHSNPAKFNQAIMEFGALFCTVANPNCEGCPFRVNCVAFNEDRVKLLPVKNPPQPKKKRFFSFLLVQGKAGFVIDKRGEGDIWANMYQLPLIEHLDSRSTESEWVEFLNLLNSDLVANDFFIESTFSHKHILTHQLLHIHFAVYKASDSVIDQILEANDNLEFLKFNDLEIKPFPVPIHKFLRRLYC